MDSILSVLKLSHCREGKKKRNINLYTFIILLGRCHKSADLGLFSVKVITKSQ